MYKTFHLKFESKEQWESIAESLGILRLDEMSGDKVFYLPDSCIDIVGLISNNDGVYEVNPAFSIHNGEDIIEVKPSTFKEGYHVNIQTKNKLSQELNQFLVYPTFPYSRFA